MNSLFLTPGGDPYAHLRPHLTSVPAAALEGVWATVELQPDLFSRQRYTVGVAVADMQGGFSFRLLDDLGKFDYLFGRDAVASIRSMLESVEQTLLRAQKEKLSLASVQFDSSALSLGDLWPTSGSSIDAILSRLYADAVPFLPKDERRVRDFVTLDNASVRKLVDMELKRISGLDFERFVKDPQRQIRDSSTGESHWLEFNLEPPGKAGNVISAVYKTPDRIELNFLRASRDLATYARIQKLSDLAVFVMAPAKDSMPPSDLDRIENILGEQSWNLEQQGFTVSTHDTALPLAKDVWEWAEMPE